jgi:hypothetical protein
MKLPHFRGRNGAQSGRFCRSPAQETTVKTLSSTQLLFLGTILSLTSGAFAQLPVTASSGTVVASGLNDPRGLAFDQDGALYIAEAGTGGTTSTVGTCTQGLPPIGPYKGGPRSNGSAPTNSSNTVEKGRPLPRIEGHCGLEQRCNVLAVIGHAPAPWSLSGPRLCAQCYAPSPGIARVFCHLVTGKLTFKHVARFRIRLRICG